jgi:hypothetical protein
VLVGNVVSTLVLLVAALFLTSVPVTATGTGVGKPTDPISRIDRNNPSPEQQSAAAAENKFFTSLRFWERGFWDRNKNQPQQRQTSTTVIASTPPPQERATAAATINDAPPVPPVLSDAPIPPHLSNTVPGSPTNVHAVRERTELGNAPLPTGQLANFAHTPNGVLPYDAKTTAASYISYSFDTRDWVDSFPLQQEHNAVVESVVANNMITESVITESVLDTQPMSFRLPTNEPPNELLQNRTERTFPQNNNDNQWNGQATALVSHVQRPSVPSVAANALPPVSSYVAPLENRRTSPFQEITSAVPGSKAVAPAVTPVEPPQIDLSPSYSARLPHVQTCGVVVVQANFPLTEIAPILEEIAQLQYDLNRYIGMPPPKEKIELCLFRDETSYISFLREVFPRAPRDRRALYVKLDNKPGTLMVQKSKDFEVDLRHEMTHAIIHASIERVPIWLDEGLAKYFEVPKRDRANKHPYMTQVRWNVKFGNIPSLDRLAKLETIDDMGPKEYRDSWAWTHFLIHRSPETHQLLASYLHMLANGEEITGEDTANTSSSSLLGGNYFEMSLARGREKPLPPIPPLKLYLDDIISNQRETFREHFGSPEK